MSYCLAINVEGGLVFCSDSRTNAGVDNVTVTVGPPVEPLIYRRNTLTEGRRCQHTEDHPFAREISAKPYAGRQVVPRSRHAGG